MKVSVIIPVKNEEANIADLLDSIMNQSFMPDEIIITDGGSTDRTIEIINDYIAKRAPIKLILEERALPGRGRNIAIANAKNEIIVMTDGGIILDKDWLENITAPFVSDSAIEVVYGAARCYAKTLFEKCFFIVYVPRDKKIDGELVNYFPFLASTAIKRYVWEKIGYFREDLRACEDLIFLKEIEKRKFKTKAAPHAVIYWRPRKNLKEAFNLSLEYTKNSAMVKLFNARVIRKFVMYTGLLTLLLYSTALPWLMLLLLSMVIINTMLVCKKHWAVFLSLISTKPEALVLIPLIILSLDIGSILGFSAGISKRILANLKIFAQRINIIT